jgi:hypothetical protein
MVTSMVARLAEDQAWPRRRTFPALLPQQRLAEPQLRIGAA